MFDTQLTPEEEAQFGEWRKKNVDPRDTGEDYDLRGAFKAGLTPGADGHWPDTYKKPNHPTFSDESIYSSLVGTRPGHWENNEKYIPFDSESNGSQTLGKGNKMDLSSFMGSGFGNTGDIGGSDYGSLTGQPSSGTPELSGMAKLARVLQAGGSDARAQELRDSVKKDLPGLLGRHLQGMKIQQGKSPKDLVEEQLNQGHFKVANDRHSVWKTAVYNKMPALEPTFQVAGMDSTNFGGTNISDKAEVRNLAGAAQLKELKAQEIAAGQPGGPPRVKAKTTDEVIQHSDAMCTDVEKKKRLGVGSNETMAQRQAREKREADEWANSFK